MQPHCWEEITIQLPVPEVLRKLEAQLIFRKTVLMLLLLVADD